MKTNSAGTCAGGEPPARWTPESCGALLEAAGDTLRPGGLELTQYLLGLGNLRAGSRILDAGCGMGATLRYLTKACRLEAVGVDSSATMLEAARSHSEEAPLFRAELEKLPFGAANFDAVICECVLSQTAATTVLAEFRRVLRGNGLLLVSDIHRRSAGPDREADLAAGDRLATKEQTETMLKDAGFAVEQWEDRTRDLRELAVRLIMAPGPARENLFGWKGQGCLLNGTETGMDIRDVGYHILVARRSP